tara:strand:- start:447 stop:752 length:306 start_codon:yes stop_codon:yes gene_type:complete
MTPEGILKKEITDYLDSLPRCAYKRIYTGGIKGRSNPGRGMTDLVACNDGEVFFIETKTKEGKLRESQEEFMIEFSRAGANIIIARSLEDVKKRIKVSPTR